LCACRYVIDHEAADDRASPGAGKIQRCPATGILEMARGKRAHSARGLIKTNECIVIKMTMITGYFGTAIGLNSDAILPEQTTDELN
jgi:hypothetical protein